MQPSLLLCACLLAAMTAVTATSCPKNGPPSNAQWHLTASVPSGCNGAACSYFVGIRTNEDPLFLDFKMEGNTKDGRIAVGYTPNKDMPNGIIFACALIGSQVTVLDTYNRPNALSNEVDTSQDLCPFNMSFVNGRISCVFSRAIQRDDTLQDMALDGSYYQLTGRTDAAGPNMDVHGHRFSIRQVNITNDVMNITNDVMNSTNNTAVVLALIKAHGILMVVAWPVAAVTANLFVTLMKPAPPGSVWIKVRRGAQGITLITGVAAALCIFLARKVASSLGNFNDPEVAAHFALGIILIILNIINPILSCVPRCAAWLKDWMVKLILVPCTVLGVILSLINIAIGLSLYENSLSLAPVAPSLTPVVPSLAVFLAFVAFFVLFTTTSFVFYTLMAIIRGPPHLAPSVIWPLLPHAFPSFPDPSKANDVIQMTELDVKVKTAAPPAANDSEPPQDSPLKWAGIAAYMVVMVPMMAAVIVLIVVFQ